MVTQQKRRKADDATWWDGESTRSWRLLVLLFIGMLSFISAYIFNEVSSIPKVYPNKEEIIVMKKEIVGHLDRLGDKIDEINKYLRDTKR